MQPTRKVTNYLSWKAASVVSSSLSIHTYRFLIHTFRSLANQNLFCTSLFVLVSYWLNALFYPVYSSSGRNSQRYRTTASVSLSSRQK